MAKTKTKTEEVIETTDEFGQGAFGETLKRSNKEIKNDRADAIYDDAEIAYRRLVEDLERKLKNLKRERKALRDLAPSTAGSLNVAKDFDAENFANKDSSLSVQIESTELKFKVAQGRYDYLFGDK